MDTLNKWNKLDSNLLAVSFTLIRNTGGILISVLIIKSVWFERSKIACLLIVTRIPEPNILSGFIKFKNIICIIKFTSVLTFICLMFGDYSSTKQIFGVHSSNSKYLDICITAITSHVLNFTLMSRSQLIIIIYSLMTIKQNIKKELIHCGGNIYKAIEIYRNLKDRMDLINSFLGNHIFAYNLVVVGFYCGVPAAIMSNHVFHIPITIVMCFVMDTTGWMLAAEFFHSIQSTFMKWHDFHTRNNSYVLGSIPANKLLAFNVSDNTIIMSNVLMSMQTQMEIRKLKCEFVYEPLALSCKYFRVTYGFLKAVSCLLNFLSTLNLSS